MKEFWEKHKANLGLAVLIIYTLCLGVATADELFHLGLFPPKLDRLIEAAIKKFADPNPQTQEAAVAEVLEYGDFAVPQLIKALDKEGTVREKAIICLQKISDQKFTDPEQWKKWYEQHKDEF